MSEEKAEFRVSDRRHFRPDGEARDRDAVEESAGEEAGSVAARPESAAVDFASFVLSLAAQAVILLRGVGETPEAKTPADRDLEAARHIVSVLEMLQDKTEGRRTQEESRLLEDLLFELRMGYVARSQEGKQ
jgi:hypothetical protein